MLFGMLDRVVCSRLGTDCAACHLEQSRHKGQYIGILNHLLIVDRMNGNPSEPDDSHSIFHVLFLD